MIKKFNYLKERKEVVNDEYILKENDYENNIYLG